ncbi:hypothetical protein BT69DRAFT_1334994 [Atractiella rhizophila]|nr:hypothetical protein BT69DRAFT_1334994 [Atractiella rhizophila]
MWVVLRIEEVEPAGPVDITGAGESTLPGLQLEERQKALEPEEEKRRQRMLMLLQVLKEQKYASCYFWGEGGIAPPVAF